MNNGEIILISVAFGTTLFTIYCIYCVLGDTIKAKRRRLNAKKKSEQERNGKI